MLPTIQQDGAPWVICVFGDARTVENNLKINNMADGAQGTRHKCGIREASPIWCRNCRHGAVQKCSEPGCGRTAFVPDR